MPMYINLSTSEQQAHFLHSVLLDHIQRHEKSILISLLTKMYVKDHIPWIPCRTD